MYIEEIIKIYGSNITYKDIALNTKLFDAIKDILHMYYDIDVNVDDSKLVNIALLIIVLEKMK